MRTSLTDIRQTEAYLQQQLGPEERLFFEARLLTSPLLRLNLRLQQKVYALLRLHQREKLAHEIAAVHQQLFNDPQKAAFQQEIFQIFKQK